MPQFRDKINAGLRDDKGTNPMSTHSPRPAGLIPKGAFVFPVEGFRETRHFAFLLLPEFTMLAFSSALEPFRIANQLAQKPLYRWAVLSEAGAPVASSSGIAVVADGALDTLDGAAHLFVCSGNRGTEVASDRVLSAIRRHARFGGALGGICTGAATLARAGLLRARRFTLHWENQPGFIETFPDLAPSPNKFEIDGTLMTCGGGAAATQMMLSVIAADYGSDFAIVVADMCLNSGDITPNAKQRSSIARAISSRNTRLLSVMRQMYENIEEPLSMADLSTACGLSRRQIERLFDAHLAESPAAVYRNIRLDRARALLAETDLPVADIAAATGFSSSDLLSRHMKARFGETPQGLRRR